MTPYDFGVKQALVKLAVYPEEYNASGNLWGLTGATGGAVAGGYAGHELADMLGKSTRSHLLGVPIPYTGVGEHFFGTSPGPIAGTVLGAAGGAALGGAMGQQAGHLGAIHRGAPPRRLIQPGNQVDPQLMAYLTQQQAQ